MNPGGGGCGEPRSRYCTTAQVTRTKLRLKTTTTTTTKKLKIDLPYDQATLLLSIYLQLKRSAYQRDSCTAMFTTALFLVVRHGINLSAHQCMNG